MDCNLHQLFIHLGLKKHSSLLCVRHEILKQNEEIPANEILEMFVNLWKFVQNKFGKGKNHHSANKKTEGKKYDKKAFHWFFLVVSTEKPKPKPKKSKTAFH